VDAQPHKTDIDRQKSLDQFRTKAKRLTIHPAERFLLWVVSAHLAFLPWALGDMAVWSQWVSLGLALAGFALALIPRRYSSELTGADAFRMIMWPRLIRFPLFWIGLALILLNLIQAANPSWTYVEEIQVWWMRKIPYQAWLPTGVDVPWAKWGSWRQLVINLSAWLTVCTIWVGFTRRRSLHLMFLTIAGNGLAVAGFGLIQRLAGNGKMYWFYDSPNSSFFAGFIYKNHAGSYLFLTLAVTCGLAIWYYLRGLRRLEKSDPSSVFGFLTVCVAVAIAVSGARGITLTMIGFLAVCATIFIGHQIFAGNSARRPLIAVALLCLFGICLKPTVHALNFGKVWARIETGLQGKDTSVESRAWARTASIDMLSENWKMGVGAGGFKFLFSTYKFRHLRSDVPESGMVWEHAHCDFLEFPIEYGLAGVILFAAAAGYISMRLIRSAFWRNPLSSCAVLGAVLLAVSAWWDFPLHCPAVLVHWLVLLTAVPMWTELENQAGRS
jgi:hypothetical protein